MTTPFPFAPSQGADLAAEEAMHALADGLSKTIRLSLAFASAGRAVDLAGLESGVGLLCAKALDLPPDRGRQFRPRLILLRQDLDELGHALRSHAPA